MEWVIWPYNNSKVTVCMINKNFIEYISNRVDDSRLIWIVLSINYIKIFSELEFAIKKLKRNKSTCPADNIMNILLKLVIFYLVNFLTYLIRFLNRLFKNKYLSIFIFWLYPCFCSYFKLISYLLLFQRK